MNYILLMLSEREPVPGNNSAHACAHTPHVPAAWNVLSMNLPSLNPPKQRTLLSFVINCSPSLFLSHLSSAVRRDPSVALLPIFCWFHQSEPSWGLGLSSQGAPRADWKFLSATTIFALISFLYLHHTACSFSTLTTKTEFPEEFWKRLMSKAPSNQLSKRWDWGISFYKLSRQF